MTNWARQKEKILLSPRHQLFFTKKPDIHSFRVHNLTLHQLKHPFAQAARYFYPIDSTWQLF